MSSENTFYCVRCQKTLPKPVDGIGTGYSENRETGDKTCYACCADVDREYMREHGKITLYLSDNDTRLTNWPGTLVFAVGSKKSGKHNIERTVTNVWFAFDGYIWNGKSYGDGMLCNCKRTKERAGKQTSEISK